MVPPAARFPAHSTLTGADAGAMTDWAEKRLLEVIGEEDEVVLAYVKGILQAGGSPEAKAIHVTLDGFLGAVSTHCPLGARYTRAVISVCITGRRIVGL